MRYWYLLAIAFLMAGCAPQQIDYLGPEENLTLNYSVTSYSFSPYRETIQVFPNGSISSRVYELDKTGKVIGVTRSADKELGADYDELLHLVTEKPDFFTLPKELINEQCRDGASEQLTIDYNGRTHSVSAYCTDNKKFNSIADFLRKEFFVTR